MRYPNNIKALQAAKGWTIDRAAEAMGMSRGGYLKIQRGENRLTSSTIRQASRAFDVSEAEIVHSIGTVPLVGMVSAGADDVSFSEGQGPLDEIEAPAWANGATVAVEIRGTSLGRLMDGWVAFYNDRRDPPESDLVGRVCICGLKDGRVVIKRLMRGSAPGLWHLESSTEQTLFDVFVTWAAPVKEMRPR